MAYDERLAERVRMILINEKPGKIEEKKMFGGLCFMVNEKMCVCVRADSILIKLSPKDYARTIEDGTLEPMLHIGRKMTGFGYVAQNMLRTTKQLTHWMRLALQFNVAGKKRKKVNYNVCHRPSGRKLSRDVTCSLETSYAGARSLVAHRQAK